MTATPAPDLELPVYDPTGLDREERIAAVGAVRDAHWLARTPLGFAVTRYEDAAAVLRDRRFHSALSLIPRMQGLNGNEFEERRRSILSMEGDEHTRLRRLVNGAFTPAVADRLRPFMREVAGELLDRVAAVGHCDFVAQVCEPYPIPIICELLGAPRRTGSSSRGGPPTSSRSSIRTSPRTTPRSSRRRRSSRPVRARARRGAPRAARRRPPERADRGGGGRGPALE